MNCLDLWAFGLMCDFNPYHGPDGRFTSGGGSGRIKMSRSEFERVSSGILTDHPRFEIGSRHFYYYGTYYYEFVVNAPGEYRFIRKMPIAGTNKGLEK